MNPESFNWIYNLRQSIQADHALVDAARAAQVARRIDLVLASPKVRETFVVLWPELVPPDPTEAHT